MSRPLLFACLLLAPAMKISAQTQQLTPELLWKLGRVTLNCVSPDGNTAVYDVTRYDVAADKGTHTLYAVDIKNGKVRPLTEGAESSTDAEYRPDGQRIGFLRGGKLWEVKPDGTGPRQVSDFEIEGFHYSPDGKKLLYVQSVQHIAPPSQSNADLPKTTGRVSESLFYRHWKEWRDGKFSNLFYAAYTDGKLGAISTVMNEAYDTPLKPLGGMEQIAWSADSRFILYTCRKLDGTAESQSTNSDLYLYELANGKTLNVTEGMLGYDQDPVFSPDGHYLAWTSMERPGYESDRTRLMVLDLRTNERRELTEGWTYEANAPKWAPDSKSLYFQSATDFTYQLFQIGLNDKKPRRITSGQHDYGDFKVAGNQLIATRVAMDMPGEVYAVDAQSGADRRLTFVTDDVWKTVSKGKVERHTVKTTDGKDMNAWVILPPDFDPAKKYPALLYCQGGPQSAVSQFFSYRWNFELMAAQGYVVIAPCRRGMPGSGQAWNDAIQGDWGGQPMQDLLSATDYIAKQPYVDAQNLGAVGASYGGYSVYWLAGHHQKRFKTFIAHDGVFNLESFYGTTEELWFPDHDFGGAYWKKEKPATYLKDSPHLFVQNWDTPILVITNELDFRVPFTEGAQAFQAAQLRGIPSKMLSFPDEGHWMSKPQNSLLWQRTYFDWLGKYLKKKV